MEDRAVSESTSGSDVENRRRTTKEPLKFKCSQCPKSFTRASTLRDHKLKHSGQRPFSCNACLKRFARLKDKNRHEKLHSTDEEFVCEGRMPDGLLWGCKKSFAREDALSVHLRKWPGCIGVGVFTAEADVLRDADEILDDVEGTWTCRSNFGLPLATRGRPGAFGCGQTFTKRVELVDHVFEYGCRNGKDLVSEASIANARQFRLQKEISGPSVSANVHDGEGPPYNSETYEKARVIHIRSRIGLGGIHVEIKLEFGRKGLYWKPFDLHFGEETIQKFTIKGCGKYSFSESRFSHVYMLHFDLPEYQAGSPLRIPITLRVNLVGDLSSYTYDTMALGFYTYELPKPDCRRYESDGKVFSFPSELLKPPPEPSLPPPSVVAPHLTGASIYANFMSSRMPGIRENIHLHHQEMSEPNPPLSPQLQPTWRSRDCPHCGEIYHVEVYFLLHKTNFHAREFGCGPPLSNVVGSQCCVNHILVATA